MAERTSRGLSGMCIHCHPMQKEATLTDRPEEIYSCRSEVVQRLLARECELCDSKVPCEVHHIRKLADLRRPGQREKPLWVRRMAARRRKTLVVCQECHEQIHRDGTQGHGQTAQITGEPREIERLTRGSERDCRKSARKVTRRLSTLLQARF